MEWLYAIATLVSALLSLGFCLIVAGTILVSLLIGVVESVVSLGYKFRKESHVGHSSNDHHRNSVDSDLVVVG